MKILLDECVTKKAKPLFSEHEVYTVAEMGFRGLKNGKLLTKMECSGFDILITIDKNIDFQQNIGNRSLTIVIFDVLKSNLRYIDELIPMFKKQISTFEKGKTYRMYKL